MKNNEIAYLSKGIPSTKIHKGEEYQSGIWKEQVNELHVGFNQINGDDVANHVKHGGADRVVCVYPSEHYTYWESVFGTPLEKSAFGENLTVTNMKENQVCIGDIFQIGEAVLQVSQGRYPCATINKRNDNNLLLKEIIHTGFTGYFFRVLKEGKITSTSQIKKVQPHPMKITVSHIHQLYFHEPTPSVEAIQKVLAVEDLATPWREKLQDLIKK